jgi:hypothetical protein
LKRSLLYIHLITSTVKVVVFLIIIKVRVIMKHLLKLIALCCVVASVDFAQAQTCSTTNKQSLKDCTNVGVDTCRAASACNDFEPVLTIDDVTQLAIENCCGKSSKTARNLCLVKEAKKYLPAVASGDQKAFFKAARNEVKRVRTSVCKNSTYSIPASSALF